MPLTESDYENVIAHSPEIAPFDHEQPWVGSAGGAWKFWNRVAEARRHTAPRREE